jgi:hypothetical protein
MLLGPPLPDPILNGVPKDKIAKDTGDEIDIELLGKSPREGSNNVFYRGLLEFSKHDQYHAVPNGIAAFNKWTFEWKSDTITFLLNDKVLRTYSKSGPEADSYLVPGVRFFPDRPQKIQVSIVVNLLNSRWDCGHLQLIHGLEGCLPGLMLPSNQLQASSTLILLVTMILIHQFLNGLIQRRM